jgi:hypothetical protein
VSIKPPRRNRRQDGIARSSGSAKIRPRPFHGVAALIWGPGSRSSIGSPPGRPADRREGAAPPSDEKACLRFCCRWLTGRPMPCRDRVKAGRGQPKRVPAAAVTAACAPNFPAALTPLRQHRSRPASIRPALQRTGQRLRRKGRTRSRGIYYPYEISDMNISLPTDFGASVSLWIIRTLADACSPIRRHRHRGLGAVSPDHLRTRGHPESRAVASQGAE